MRSSKEFALTVFVIFLAISACSSPAAATLESALNTSTPTDFATSTVAAPTETEQPTTTPTQERATDDPTLLAGIPIADWESLIMPGYIIAGSVPKGYEYSIVATVDEIIDFYETELAIFGHQLEAINEEGERTTLTFSNGTTPIFVLIDPFGDYTIVTITTEIS